MSDKEPWTRIREWKERKEAKERAKEEAALQGPQAPAAASEPFAERFKPHALKEKMLFGGIVGAVTGSFFGSVDAYNGMKREQAFGIPLKTPQAKAQFAGQIVGSSSLIFGGFYAAYHGVKYLTRVARDEDDITNALMAGLATVGPMLASATFRRNTAYAVLLIGMDIVGEQGEPSKPQQ